LHFDYVLVSGKYIEVAV